MTDRERVAVSKGGPERITGLQWFGYITIGAIVLVVLAGMVWVIP